MKYLAHTHTTFRWSTGFVALGLAMVGLTSQGAAHQGHTSDAPWVACESLSLDEPCSFEDTEHAVYRGTCQLMSDTLMCVRNRPIEYADPGTDAAHEHGDYEHGHGSTGHDHVHGDTDGHTHGSAGSHEAELGEVFGPAQPTLVHSTATTATSVQFETADGPRQTQGVLWVFAGLVFVTLISSVLMTIGVRRRQPRHI